MSNVGGTGVGGGRFLPRGGVNSYQFDRRQAERLRAQAVQVQVTQASGFVTTTGSGEGLVDIFFPNWFVEKPAFSFGAELDVNQAPVRQQFPTVSVVVANWRIENKGLASYWSGATLAIVTTGPATQVTIVHWQANGKALSAPSDTPVSNGTGIA